MKALNNLQVSLMGSRIISRYDLKCSLIWAFVRLDGYVIPAGARIVLSIYMVHHNKDIYPNPEIWNPENFSAEKIASRHPCSFIPFGSGIRMCLGTVYLQSYLFSVVSLTSDDRGNCK